MYISESPQASVRFEAKWLWQKWLFYSHVNETYYHKKGFALSFARKVMVCGTRKLPVDNAYFILIKNINYEKMN